MEGDDDDDDDASETDAVLSSNGPAADVLVADLGEKENVRIGSARVVVRTGVCVVGSRLRYSAR